MKTAKVEGQVVRVGDWVGFKSDIEQHGQITKITEEYCYTKLHLHNDHGFSGEYLRYATDTVVDADDCWVE
jgi:hypothetical protein